MKPKTITQKIDELNVVLTLALAQTVFINAVAYAFISFHPEAKKVLALSEFHLEKIRDRLADEMVRRKLTPSLKSFLDGISGFQSPDVFGQN